MRFFISVFIILTSIAPAWSDETRLDYSGRTVIYHSDVKLRGSQKRDVRYSHKANFFGAVAINTTKKTNDSNGAAWGYHNLKTAQDNAMRSCRFKADRPEDCVLYLSVVPKGFDFKPKTRTLSNDAVEAYNFLVGWSRLNFDSYRSFAVNGIHTWAYSASAPTREAAEKEALEVCEETFARSQKKKDPAWAKAVYLKEHLQCRIFVTFSPV
ncbi:hypothetical protein [Roseibium sp. RKSG952]|uniref:hypothetical protein n=1 Tax=Roseibium sp. RKSG952 TaxID=2529384 RepID=UPI0012BCE538|nr:hypothetical protein [Roseibium sp. RKSG952]MTI03168.1 hypothetical protein [Roseibium sp. RKSG952]